MKSPHTIGVFLGLCVSSVAYAEREASRSELLLLPRALDASVTSVVQVPEPKLEVIASRDSAKVALQFRISPSVETKLRSLPYEGLTGEGRRSLVQGLSILLQAPIDKSKQQTDIVNLDGLVNAASVTLKYNGFTIARRKPSQADRDAYCGRAMSALLALPVPTEPIPGEPTSPEDCKKGVDSFGLQRLGTKWLDEYEDMYFSDRFRLVFGLSSTVGTQEFKFFDETSLAKNSRRETPWSVSVNLGFAKETYGLLQGGFRYEDAFKDKAKRTLCTPIPGSPTQTCETEPFGEPERNKSPVVFAEWRHQLDFVGVDALAVSPTVTHNFKTDVTAVELPVYLWRDKDGNLSGGVRTGWRSDTDDFAFGIFVGTAFKFFD